MIGKVDECCFYEALFPSDVILISWIGWRRSLELFLLSINMPLHHAQMCMFGRLPFGPLGVNRT